MKALALFAAGMILGVVLMVAFRDRDDNNQVALIAAVEPSPDSPVEAISPSIVDEYSQTAEPEPNLQRSAQLYELRLPERYQDMIGPARPRKPSFSERHAWFSQEPRDETWAFSMEAGISNFYAVHAPNFGVVIDSIECRSENCEVAGYLVDGTEHLSSNLYEFTSEPWWQGSNAVSVHEFEADRREFFVLVTFQFDGPDSR